MKNLFIYKLLIVMIMAIVGAYFYNKLPNIVPIHWGIDGKPDRMGNKLFSLTIFPIITLLMVILFPILSKFDPKKENYEKFSKIWEIFQFSIIGFFAYIYFITIYASMNTNINISKFMLFGIGVLFIVLGNYMGKIRQNYFVGIKLPWTLANEEVWNKTHRFGGKMFMLGGVLLFLDSFLLFSPLILFIIILSLILIMPIIYSYLIFKK